MTVSAPPVHNTRKLRNLVLDGPLQLKFAFSVVGSTLAVSGLLGAFLLSQSGTLFREMEAAVDARSRAAEASRELGQIALSKELLERFDDPAFAQQLDQQSKEINRRYEEERAQVVEQRAQLMRGQRQVAVGLALGLLAFVLLVTLYSLMLTHRIAGPLYRMRRIAEQISAGQLVQPITLRPGDQLQDFFESFRAMVEALRMREEQRIQRLDRILADAESTGRVNEASINELRALRNELRTHIAAVPLDGEDAARQRSPQHKAG